MTPLLLRAAVASASFLAAFGGALPDAPRAFEAVPGEAWVLSEVHSIDPSTQPLEEVEENYAFAFDGWLGTPPGVIQPSNVEVSDGALKLKIMNDESFDFKVRRSICEHRTNRSANTGYYKEENGYLKSLFYDYKLLTRFYLFSTLAISLNHLLFINPVTTGSAES